MRTDLDAQAMQMVLEHFDIAIEAALLAGQSEGISKGGPMAEHDFIAYNGMRKIIRERRAAIAALQSRLSAPVGDAVPVAWTLQSALDRRETTCRARLWFDDPMSAAWTPLYTHPAPDAVRRETVEACALIAEQWGNQKVDKWCKEDGDEGMCQVAKVSAWDALQVAHKIRAMLKGE